MSRPDDEDADDKSELSEDDAHEARRDRVEGQFVFVARRTPVRTHEDGHQYRESQREHRDRSARACTSKRRKRELSE